MLLKIALLQLTSTADIAGNIAAIEPMVQQAAAAGAQLIALPENAFYMRAEGEEPGERYTVETHPGVIASRQWASALGVWILAGSVGIAPADANEKRRYNRSLLINPQGEIAAAYDKIHLFDVEVGDGQVYRESARIVAGERAVQCTIDNVQCTIGLTICYDLRFPQLFRALAKAGANVIAVPSAFTVPTGEAHWHVLLRARAIENSCFIIAPAQCGEHPGPPSPSGFGAASGRKTYGHSLVVDPWGKIIAERTEDTPGILMAELDLNEVARVRKMLPSLEHDREFMPPLTLS